MPIGQDIFETMPVRSYADARGQIQNGDIALFAGREGGSRVIEYFTHSLFCHVGFVWRMDDIDRIMLLESVENIGVRMLPLSCKVNGGESGQPYNGKLVIGRHQNFPLPGPDFNRDFGRMTQFAVDRLGCPYNAEEIVMIGATIGAGLAGLPFPAELKPSHAYICSEYAAACYHELGVEIARERPNFIAPSDFANDAKVQPIVTIAPDGAV
jgi:hypothetical protein